MPRSAGSGRICPGRRRFLAALGGLAPGLLVSCRGAPAPAIHPVLRLPLADLPVGARHRVHLGDVPVELLREGDRVAARSLLCTHQGCEVRFEPGPRRYRCPCHGGLFDEQGRPIEGPPSRALVAVPARLEGDTLVVGPFAPERKAPAGRSR